MCSMSCGFNRGWEESCVQTMHVCAHCLQSIPLEAYVERTPISQLGQPGQPHSWILTPRGRQAGLLHLGTNERLRVKMDALRRGE
jgi:hypothetical protein